MPKKKNCNGASNQGGFPRFATPCFSQFDPKSEEFAAYLERFECYTRSYNITGSRKRDIFLSCIGPQMYGQLRGLALPRKPLQLSFEELTSKLLSSLKPKCTPVVQRKKLHDRIQEPGEPFMDFLDDLHTIAASCGFKSNARVEEAVRDQIINGICDITTRDYFFQNPDLRLHQVVAKALADEQALAEIESRGGGRRCRVLFSYSPQNDDELQLQVNDEIDFLAEVEDGWWKGRLGNKIGVFPSNFVCEVSAEESLTNDGEVLKPLASPEPAPVIEDAPLLPPKPVKEQCRVLFAYDAANDDELTLKKDDVITILTKDVEDKGWWKGELRGKIGLFPDNFVEVMTPPEDVAVNLQKKPDRPSKTFDRTEVKSPLISVPGFQKTMQENSNSDKFIAGLKNEGPHNEKNVQNLERNKTEPGKFGEKPAMFPGKGPDSMAAHRKSLDIKSLENHLIAGKKPVLPPPPVSNKPKPALGKPGQVKRLSEEINDLIENSGNKFPGKRTSGDVHDLVDGGTGSKMTGPGRLSDGNVKEEFDLDLVERNDMLTHMTSSRPRPPGRRLPTKEAKENEPHSPLTNGNVETNDKEKSQKEREWEKHKPPWVNELKLNLKSSKTSPSDSKSDKKSAPVGQVKSATQSPVDVSPSNPTPETNVPSNVTLRQFSPQSSGAPRVQSMFETGSKVSELSSKFSAVKPMSPPKPSEVSWNSVADQTNEEVVHVSKKEFVDLKSKVEKMEKMLLELTGQLYEEMEKRKLIEMELNKLTDLVTQV